MKKLATILILFLSVGFLGIKNVNASVLDDLPDITSLSHYAEDYVLFRFYDTARDLPAVYGIMFANEGVSGFKVYSGLTSPSCSAYGCNDFTSETNPYGIYLIQDVFDYSPRYGPWGYYMSEGGNSWTIVSGNTTESRRILDQVGHYYGVTTGVYEILKTTLDIVNKDNTSQVFYAAGYEVAGEPAEPQLYISDTHDSTNHNATITVDTSDFSDGDYKYKWGYDQMAMAMQEIASGTNGYTITVPYNDTIYFAVLEQDDTLVYETTYTIDYDDMPNQYALHFHSWTSWGCNDIVKFVNDNTDYTSPNFWEAGEKLIFFYGYQRRVALGFYADSNLTNRLSLDGSVEFDHDAEIYVKWSTKIPNYQISVYPDDDTIKFRFQVTEWLEESRNYQILFNQDIYHVNYTMVYGSRQDGYTTPVDYDENVTIRVVYTENGETVTVWTEEIDISVWVTLYASEDDQEAINLIVEANNVSNNIDAWEVLEDFVELLRVPIDFIIGLISHLYNKLNLHTRVFLIGIFVAEMIAAVAKLMFKR